MLGDPAADGTVVFDFCDRCESRISQAINVEMTEIGRETVES